MVFMKKKLLIDSSAVLNDFNFEFESCYEYFVTPEIASEFIDFRSKALLENALSQRILKIVPATQKSFQDSEERASELGSVLSKPDLSLAALALDFKKNRQDFIVLTDDFSLQNLLKSLGSPFRSIIRGEIKKIMHFKKK
jgi:endoribonuclease Nob1